MTFYIVAIALLLISFFIGMNIGIAMDILKSGESVSLSDFRDMCGLLKGQLRYVDHSPFFKKEFCEVAAKYREDYYEFTFEYTFTNGGR